MYRGNLIFLPEFRDCGYRMGSACGVPRYYVPEFPSCASCDYLRVDVDLFGNESYRCGVDDL